MFLNLTYTCSWTGTQWLNIIWFDFFFFLIFKILIKSKNLQKFRIRLPPELMGCNLVSLINLLLLEYFNIYIHEYLNRWWVYFRCHAPVLQKLVIQIFSQTNFSSAGCKHNRSIFQRIHIKKRNRLKDQRLYMLTTTYICKNKKSKYKLLFIFFYLTFVVDNLLQNYMFCFWFILDLSYSH